MSTLQPRNLSGHSERRESRQIDFTTCPVFNRPSISEEEILKIAKKAVELAKEDMYDYVKKEFSAELGSSILNKLAYMVGATVLGAFMWLSSHNFIKL